MTIAPETTDCAVFVTHIWSHRIARHFERLRREAGTILPVFLAFHRTDPDARLPDGMPADIVVCTDDCARLVPYRYRDHVGRGPIARSGYVDMVWIAILLDPRLGACGRLWMLEYDVDFSGNWTSFFEAAAGYEGDLLAAYVRTRSEDPDWSHWPSLQTPPVAPSDPTVAFMPISRFSRRLLETLRDVLAVPGWQGHLEAVLPTVAIANRLSVNEIGGSDPRLPSHRRGRHYTADYRNSDRSHSTHRFSTRGFSYFVDQPGSFRRRNMIHHPIKTELPDDQVIEIRRRLWSLRLRESLPPALAAFIRRMRRRS